MAKTYPAPRWEFVPQRLDPSALDQLEPLFADLLARQLDTAAATERWLRDESELLSRLNAEVARRYVRMTCNTDDPQARAAYLHMEQQVMPRAKVRCDQLDKLFLQSPGQALLDAVHYAVLLRARRSKSEIFREANTELQQREAELVTQQQELMGSLTVPFDGQTLTLQQLAPYAEKPDRAVREAAFRAGIAARRQAWDRLEELFDALIGLRTQMGRNAGFRTYAPFRHQELGRYDYTETDCRKFHDAIAECVVPIVRELDRERAHRLGLDRLRPWDLEVDPEGRAALRPFESQPQLVGLTRQLFAAVDERFAEEFDALVARDLLDLMSRKGKAPGGYQYQLEDDRVPFIFANSVGVHNDVQTLLHEGGHAFHSLACRDFDLLAYRDYPIEMAETASMSMELLGLEHLAMVYGQADAARVRSKHLQGILRTLTWIASIDALQHWVYGQPTHTRDERRTAWLDIRRRFGGEIDWSGLQDVAAMQWIQQGHLFGSPFYYIEYGVAQLAALQVWANYRRDRTRAVADYRAALALGGSRPLPELMARAGVQFDLSADRLRALVADVISQIRAAP